MITIQNLDDSADILDNTAGKLGESIKIVNESDISLIESDLHF
jgi:hypothetical protein